MCGKDAEAAQADQPARLVARTESAGRHRPEQAAAHAPDRLIGIHTGAHPIRRR